MYPNIPEKMQRNKFRDVSCPKNARLYAQCVNLTVPKYPTGQTAVVDVDPIEALNRASLEEYQEYAEIQNKLEQKQ